MMTTPDILVFLALNIWGGAELSMLSIARGLKLAGFPVTLAVYGKACNLAGDAADLPVVELAAQRSRSVILPLTRFLREKRPRILLSALRFTNMAAIEAALLAKSGTRIIITEHTPAALHPSGSDDLKHRIGELLIGCHYPLADAVIAVSHGIADDLRHILLWRSDNVRVIYNPVTMESEPSDFPPHPWLVPGMPPAIIGVGRFSWEKNFTLLIRAFAAAQAIRPMRLILLGEGEERTHLEALTGALGISDYVLFPGFVSNVADWLAHADLFVSPSQFEGFGNAIVEAMNARVPVIATDCPVGPREILADGRYGRLVPVDDMSALAEAIVEMLENPPEQDGPHARAQEFSVQRSIEAYGTLIHELIPS